MTILPSLRESWKKNRFLLLCLGLVTLLRLPSLFEPYWYGDEGIYLTLGQAIRRGLVIYRDIHDNKPPLLYLLAAVAGNVFWFRAILLGWMLMTVVLFHKLLQELFPKKEKLIEISLFTFAIISSLPLIEGNIANAEIFMIGTTIAGFYLFLRAKKWFHYLFVGIFLALSTLFKVPAAFDFAAILVFALFVAKKKNYKLQITNYLLLLLGFSLPLLLTTAYFGIKGALDQYLTAAFIQNIGYLSSWRTGTITHAGITSQTGVTFRGLILLIILVFLYLWRKKLSKPIIVVSLWFLFSLFAALLSERPYPHYLIQTLPAFSLLIGVIFTAKKKLVKNWSLSLLGVLIIAVITINFWHYPVFGYYGNFLTYTIGLKNREAYFSWFDWRVNRTYRVAEFLLEHTPPEEKVFIWGDEPFIYALSRRLPAGRYTVAYHIVDFNGYQETIGRLKLEPPRYLILMTSEKRPFPELKSFVRQNYALEKTVEDATIYHRLL